MLESSKHAHESTVRLILQLHLLDHRITVCLFKPSFVPSWPVSLRCGAYNAKAGVGAGGLEILEKQEENRR